MSSVDLMAAVAYEAREQSSQQRIAELEAQLVAANERLRVAKDALEAIEWARAHVFACPWCRGYKQEKRHTPDCKRQLALAAIAEEGEYEYKSKHS